MNASTLARVVAVSRLAFGLALFVAPTPAARGWLGRDAQRSGTRLAVRGLGARDVVLAVGTLASLDDRDTARRWLDATITADLSDVGAALLESRGQREGRVAMGAGVALAAAALAAVARWQLDR